MSDSRPKQAAPQILETLIDQLRQVFDGTGIFDQRVTHYLSAEQLNAKIDISLGPLGSSDEALITELQNYLRYTPKTWRPEFSKLLFSGINGPGVLADWVTSVSNTTMHTYQVAPVASLMEQEIISQLNKLIGFDQGSGLMVSGGSMANMVGMMLARHRTLPNLKTQGFAGKTLVAYVSELAHYSYEKAANVLGIGSQNLIAIEANAKGQLRPDALNQAIEYSVLDNKLPFFIGLTAGTTIIGSFDPVAECAKIAQKHGLWLHIDGAWGAPALFSKRHRQLIEGAQLADSFTWDAHKLMNVPLTASAILVKDNTALLETCAGGGAAYLFHEDENADSNIGTYSLQCGRRVDSLKFWLSWKALGSRGFEKKVDRLMSLKEKMIDKIKQHPNFKLLAPSPFLNVLFQFEPTPTQKLNDAQLSTLNIAICKEMLASDRVFVDYAHYKSKAGIRFILANDLLNESDIDYFLVHCEQTGTALALKM